MNEELPLLDDSEFTLINSSSEVMDGIFGILSAVSGEIADGIDSINWDVVEKTLRPNIPMIISAILR